VGLLPTKEAQVLTSLILIEESVISWQNQQVDNIAIHRILELYIGTGRLSGCARHWFWWEGLAE
jgi:hypothetical protein